MNDSMDVIKRLGGEVYTFTFGGTKEYKINPQEDLPICDSDLSAEYAKQASLYAYVAILTAKADSKVKMEKAEFEEEEARASEKVRAKFEVEGKKTTESMINSSVSIHPDVMTKKRKLLAAQTDYALLKALEESFKIRADMLMKMGSMQQIEWNQTGMQKNQPQTALMKNILRDKAAREQKEAMNKEDFPGN